VDFDLPTGVYLEADLFNARKTVQRLTWNLGEAASEGYAQIKAMRRGGRLAAFGDGAVSDLAQFAQFGSDQL